MYFYLIFALLAAGALCCLIALAANGNLGGRKIGDPTNGAAAPPSPCDLSAEAAPSSPCDLSAEAAPSSPCAATTAPSNMSSLEQTLRLPKVEHNTDGTAINDLACAVLTGFGPLMQQRKLHLSFEPAAGDPRIDADKFLLERVIFNLLLHAVKSCWQGGNIQLQIHHADSRLQISVGDTGNGVTPQEIANDISEPPNQLLSMQQELDRAGLGLALVKEIAELMNGCLVVRSHSGRGTTVTVDVLAPLVFRKPPEPALRGHVEQLEAELALKDQELKWLARELKIAREYAVSAAQIRSRFLANMSHEIRTPLNGLIATTELILQTELDDEQRELVWINREAAFVLLETVNDLLDFSRIEGGNLNLDIVTFNLPQLVDGAANLLSMRASQKDILLELSLERSVPEKVSGDPTRLRQILINLISNAVKFTDCGKVRVEAMVEETQSDLAWVRFTVRDTGIGIAEERQQYLFEPFIQGDASLTRKENGTGLGLSIACRLVELMGGRMGLESSLGEGSSFWFCVPLKVCAQDASGYREQSRETIQCEEFEEMDSFAPPPAESTESSGARRPLILIVEDNVVNQQVARRQLEDLGCEVHIVSNGNEAVHAACSRAYDIVLMDCAMPVMDGYEATSRIREAECRVGKHTSIIAMTAHAMAEDRERCLACGMDDYLSKPVRSSDLKQVLDRWLQNPARKT